MKPTNIYKNRIKVSKHGIHSLISELVSSFNFDKFLFPKKYKLVFVAACIGIILLPKSSATYIAKKLTWISHDAITRLLPLISINTTNVMVRFVQAIQSKTADLRSLFLDDVIIRKPYGKRIDATSYVYDSTNNCHVWGMHIVVLLWSNGWFKVPIAFRIWKPKKRCEEYHTKIDLAIDMISFAHLSGLKARYVTFDTWYCCKELLQKLSSMRLSLHLPD